MLMNVHRDFISPKQRLSGLIPYTWGDFFEAVLSTIALLCMITYVIVELTK